MSDGHDFSATFYVKDAPDITFEDGHFHICHTTGKAHFEFVMRPSTFSKAFLLAEEVRAKWLLAERGNVSRIRKK